MYIDYMLMLTLTVSIGIFLIVLIFFVISIRFQDKMTDALRQTALSTERVAEIARQVAETTSRTERMTASIYTQITAGSEQQH